MIVGLDHIGVVAHSIDEARATLEDKLGFSLAASTPLPDGAYFAPEGTHNYMFQVGLGETRIEVLIPVVPEAGTYKYLQRFGPGLHHWGYGCDDVAEEAARLRANGLRQIDLGGRPDGNAGDRGILPSEERRGDPHRVGTRAPVDASARR